MKNKILATVFGVLTGWVIGMLGTVLGVWR